MGGRVAEGEAPFADSGNSFYIFSTGFDLKLLGTTKPGRAEGLQGKPPLYKLVFASEEE